MARKRMRILYSSAIWSSDITQRRLRKAQRTIMFMTGLLLEMRMAQRTVKVKADQVRLKSQGSTLLRAQVSE